MIAFVLAVVCYTVSQLQLHGKLSEDETGFWGNDSWRNKYKYPADKALFEYGKGWYYRLFKIKYKERFPLSATLLVSLTDGYHLMQLFFKGLLCVAIVFYTPLFGWWDLLIYFVTFGVVFTVCYRLFQS